MRPLRQDGWADDLEIRAVADRPVGVFRTERDVGDDRIVRVVGITSPVKVPVMTS